VCIFALALGMVVGGASKGTVILSYDNELATHYNIERAENNKVNEPEVDNVVFYEVQLQELVVSQKAEVDTPDGQRTEESRECIELSELETPTVYVDVSSVKPIKDIFDEIKNC